MKVSIIGFGNMGRTFANGFVNSRFIDVNDIQIYSRSQIQIENCFGVPEKNLHNEINEHISNSDIIIISVKPQDFEILAQNLKPYIKDNHVVLSVMAGMGISKISKLLGTDKIVRSMPNLPSQIGLGMTAISASETIDRKDLFIVQNLINTTGKSVYVEDENLINAATAVSGSGPAYVFYFMQSMIDAAQELGFSKSEAELLVKQTFLGTINLYNSNAISSEEWIKKVSSKGGTTEQAIQSFGLSFLNKEIIKGIHAAQKRAEELGS